MLVNVKKGCKGFIFNRLVNEGEELNIEESQFSSNWMVKQEIVKPARKAKSYKAKKQFD
jgi:hypothetical protein